MNKESNNDTSTIGFLFNQKAERVNGQDAADNECKHPAAPSRPGPEDAFEPHGMN